MFFEHIKVVKLIIFKIKYEIAVDKFIILLCYKIMEVTWNINLYVNNQLNSKRCIESAMDQRNFWPHRKESNGRLPFNIELTPSWLINQLYQWVNWTKVARITILLKLNLVSLLCICLYFRIYWLKIIIKICKIKL